MAVCPRARGCPDRAGAGLVVGPSRGQLINDDSNNGLYAAPEAPLPNPPPPCRFPEFSIHWVPLLRKWATESQPLRAVACDLRGYSPKASPSDPEEYLYETLATDVFAIAEAAGFDRFHLVGHDHGAGLGWLAASMDKGVRVLSWAALSVPHPDALSAVLFGPEEDEAQVVSESAGCPLSA